jgi:hypothetical protein
MTDRLRIGKVRPIISRRRFLNRGARLRGRDGRLRVGSRSWDFTNARCSSVPVTLAGACCCTAVDNVTYERLSFFSLKSVQTPMPSGSVEPERGDGQSGRSISERSADLPVPLCGRCCVRRSWSECGFMTVSLSNSDG